jgi:hypothetical protein
VAVRRGEVKDLGFPREWLTFADPADSGHEVRVDVTWLLSRWTCIFGSGCRGVVKGRADDGCCSHGAFFSDKADEKRVRSMARELSAADWQLRDAGKGGKAVVELDEAHGEKRNRTRVVDGACVFLNRPGFAGGAGCALHGYALRTGQHPVDTKPDVCWQLPVWRDEETRDTVDERHVRTTVISEFDRRQWGPGGADLHWWCTSSRDAHIGAEPLFVSYERELLELVGRPAYDELVRLLNRKLATGTAAPHPADPA